jgi:hypothetical protein
LILEIIFVFNSEISVEIAIAIEIFYLCKYQAMLAEPKKVN